MPMKFSNSFFGSGGEKVRSNRPKPPPPPIPPTDYSRLPELNKILLESIIQRLQMVDDRLKHVERMAHPPVTDIMPYGEILQRLERRLNKIDLQLGDLRSRIAAMNTSNIDYASGPDKTAYSCSMHGKLNDPDCEICAEVKGNASNGRALDQLDENVRLRRRDVQLLIDQDAPNMSSLFEAIELFIDAKLNRAAFNGTGEL